MPLSMIGEGETATITRVGGKEETRRFLENLGFVVGAIVTVISKTGGDVIVNIKESRVAIGKKICKRLWCSIYQELIRKLFENLIYHRLVWNYLHDKFILL